MQQSQIEQRLTSWEQRLSAGGQIVPYLLLAAATLLAVLTGGWSWRAWLGTLGLALLTAGWMLWFVTLHPAWAERRRLMALYYAGLLVLIGLLMTRSPWFGLFAFTGYLHAWQLLHGGWRLLGVTATALLATTWPAGGFPRADLPAIATYLVIVAITVALVILFSLLGEVTAAQSQQRQQMIDELAEANRRLEEALRENATLQARLLAQAHAAGVLDERQRLAGEIHDTLAQGLAGIITQLEAAEYAAHHPEQWRRHLHNARALARSSLTEARRSVEALRPAPLERDPLPEALATLARAWSRDAGVAVQVTITGTPQPLLPEIEATLFRVAQEALTNIGRHARATRAGLTLSYMGDVVVLDVRDDGVGFDAARVVDTTTKRGERGVGLHGMAQRVRRVAGNLTIESTPGGGTAISASVPAIMAGERGGAP
jgi:signal transduction histidine kinase